MLFRSVKGLVSIGLRRGNIVFKPVGDRAEHVVNHAQHIIAIVDGIDDDAHRIDVIDFIHTFPLDEHLPVDAVDALDTAFQDVYKRQA